MQLLTLCVSSQQNCYELFFFGCFNGHEIDGQNVWFALQLAQTFSLSSASTCLLVVAMTEIRVSLELATKYFTAVGCCSPRSMVRAMSRVNPVDGRLGCYVQCKLSCWISNLGLGSVVIKHTSFFKHFSQAFGGGCWAFCSFGDSSWNLQAVSSLIFSFWGG